MKLLLDTHAFIWWDSSPQQLSVTARRALEDANNEVVVSVISLWEIAIKQQLGKLKLHRALDEIVADQVHQGLQTLDFGTAHVLQISRLPDHHKDPFDRALIAQAMVENATLVTKDATMSAYHIPLLW
ncbi:MAG TPA: type II toxin-antitoxin system VapC family toxin [Planctomycetaceae bacterium]|nr:type II toxin-antitoxin system VapC family toxin [Planctomycetaceae bacterium]